MSCPFQAVVFDLDGLMFNTEDLYQSVGTEVLRRRGCEFTDELLDQMMGRQPPVALQLMIDYHQLDDTVAGLAAESTIIFSDILEDRLQPMPGLIDLLAVLEQAQLPKAIATSSELAFVQRVLGQYQMKPRFEFLLTAEDIEQGKPHPEIYLTAAQRLGVEPAKMLVLEDSQNGCRAAVAAGAFTVAVPAGRSHQHDFTGASLIAGSLADPCLYEALGLAACE